jgi:hypothetical protein
MSNLRKNKATGCESSKGRGGHRQLGMPEGDEVEVALWAIRDLWSEACFQKEASVHVSS